MASEFQLHNDYIDAPKLIVKSLVSSLWAFTTVELYLSILELLH